MAYNSARGWGIWGPPPVPPPSANVIRTQLGAPKPAIPDTTSASADAATINAILAALRSLGLINP